MCVSVCVCICIVDLHTVTPADFLFPPAKQHHSRIEGGMLSYGQDMDIEVNPFEVGLGWQVNMQKTTNFIGKAALQ